MNRIHFLNTIWSDCILIESCNHYALIDTGTSFYYPMIRSYLKKFNIEKLDFILLTHFHPDHYGCIVNIIDDMKVENVYLRAYSMHDGTTSYGSASSEEYHISEANVFENIKKECIEKSNLAMIGDDFKYLEFCDFKFDILSSEEKICKIYNDSNNKYYHIDKFNENYNSISLFCNLNGASIYLGGDITDCDNDIECLNRLNYKAVKSIYDKYNIDKIDIYKVAHHGVSDSNSLETLKLIRPTYAIITNTDRWLVKFKTIQDLIEANTKVKILRTDWQRYVFEIKDNGNITYYAETNDSLFDE